MVDQMQTRPANAIATVEYVTELSHADLRDLCDATDEAIKAGGGFGWVALPAREILERYWKGVLAMPVRMLFVARLDGVICGTAQLITPPRNNEAQSFAVTLTTHFIAPWARKGYGLARKMLEIVETRARDEGFSVINLDVRETMETAIRLYENMGYTHFGTHPYYARIEGKAIQGRYYYKVINPEISAENPPASS
ncbi:MAG: GNAT family N-acetyltransferase [Alphaproteobacteria bacterium CG_4_9_14_3_um_filter_47_13]|nr:MAG: GNAT family N-acetyltransferase [Alphaproteobacteria bacterium CG_4_9_14_3_um_filter_47_13]